MIDWRLKRTSYRRTPVYDKVPSTVMDLFEKDAGNTNAISNMMISDFLFVYGKTAMPINPIFN